jgi:hypothetical protein
MIDMTNDICDDTTQNYFLTSWSMEGVECVIDVTEHYYDSLDLAQDALEDNGPRKPNEADRLLNGMLMRARFQTNRFEVWGLRTDKDITEEGLWAWAERDPQGFVDMVREKGVCFYNDRPRGQRKPVIQ